jgi:predicted TIM-barrel fold metal-dependent hydrolase
VETARSCPWRRVDSHVHHLSPGYRAALEREDIGYPLPEWSRDLTVEFMDAYEIDAAVMSPSPPGVSFGDRGRTRELARVCNEETAALVRSDPDRFAGLAILPLPHPGDAVAELDHALDELALDGVILLSNVEGIYPGDPVWEPVFEQLDRRAAYVFLHPNAPATPVPRDDAPVWLQEFPFETTRAVTRLIYSGTLERFPRIRLQLAHLGGTVPFLGRRIASLAEREPALAAAAPAGARSYLERLYYDTGLSDDLVAVEASRRTASLERIVFGSDWPYLAQPPGRDPAPGLGYLPSEERRLVDGLNLAALVPRLFA